MSMIARVGFLLLVSNATLLAQTQFAETGTQHMPRDGAKTRVVVLGDVDGDGDLDLVTTNQLTNSADVLLYRQVSPGVFAPGNGGAPIIANATLTDEPVLRDLDGDGDLDLLVAGSLSAPSRLFANDGTGTFTLVPGALPPTGSDVVACGDVDLDGDLDLVVGTSYLERTKLWLNTGSGTFIDVSATQMPQRVFWNTALELFDADGDGDLDLFVGNLSYYLNDIFFPGQDELYINTGGFFVDASTALPLTPPTWTLDAAAADADGDGDLDLAIGGHLSLRLYTNIGTGTFASATSLPATANEHVSRVAWLDFDLDGDQDLELGTVPRLLRNLGAGQFQHVVAAMPANLPLTTDMVAADIDQNGYPDLLFGAWEQNRLLLNRLGEFIEMTSSPMPSLDPRPVAFGDLDGDGDPDMVLGGSFCCGAPAVALLGDGDGNYVRAEGQALPVDTEVMMRPLALVDVDGDLDRDLLFLGRSSAGTVRARLYENNGSGKFKDATAGRVSLVGASSFAVGDVDGDGDVDLLFVRSSGVPQLHRHNDSGTFTNVPGALPATSLRATAIVLGDADGDGDLDAFVGIADYLGFQNRTRMWRNNGAGVFTDVTSTQMPNLDPLTNALALGDVDGDGDLDLVVGSWGSSSYPGERHRLYLNNGAGTFTDATAGRLPNVLSSTWDVLLFDADDDGDLDLLIGEFAAGHSLYRNDGTGTFTTVVGRLPAGLGISFDYAATDMDRDGDVDLLVQSRQLVNFERQLTMPLLPSIGGVLAVEVHVQPGYGTAAHLAFPFVGLARATIALPPFGVLGLDPAQMVALPAFTFSAAAAHGSVQLNLPFDPSLVGVPVSVQSLVVPNGNPAAARFTNAKTARIIWL